MALFKKKAHLTQKEEAMVLKAIREAEQGHRGEIRVHLERKCPDKNELKRAMNLFYTLNMHHTRDGTGVLLYIAPEERKTAVFAGHGIFGAEEKDFWQEVTDKVAKGFRQRKPAQGICSALEEIGDLLRRIDEGKRVHA